MDRSEKARFPAAGLLLAALLLAGCGGGDGGAVPNPSPPPPPTSQAQTPEAAPAPENPTTSAGPAEAAPAFAEATAGKPLAAPNGHGRLYTVNHCRILELSGTPEEMGEAHGQLLGGEVRRVVADVLKPNPDDARYKRILAGARVMERFQPEPYRRELAALARAAGVEYPDMVALQLFGDAERGKAPAGTPDILRSEGFPGGYQCTNFAVFGPATRTGELIAGRNFDYWPESVNAYAALVIHYRPAAGHSFVTVTWTGVINGWTLMNDAGLVAANNNAYGASESLEGISTCFMQRLAVETCSTVDEAVELVRRSPRAVGTAMLLAGGRPPTAVEVEFDHESVAVRRAEQGWVAAANGCRALGLAKALAPEDGASGRYGALVELITKNHGRIDRTMNFAAAPGVPIESINLHSALVFPADLTLAVSMGRVPACKQPYRRLRMTAEGIEAAE